MDLPITSHRGRIRVFRMPSVGPSASFAGQGQGEDRERRREGVRQALEAIDYRAMEARVMAHLVKVNNLETN